MWNLSNLDLKNVLIFEIIIDSTMSAYQTSLPKLMTQPFIENVILYGLLVLKC